MRVYLFTSDNDNNVTDINYELHSYCNFLYENSCHSIVSFVLIGAYIYKILKNQSSQFKSFLPFHILMHISIISLAVLILHAIYQFGTFVIIFIGVIGLQSYMIHAFNCLNLIITIFGFGPTVNTKKLRIILMILGFVLRFALVKVKLVVEISEQKYCTFFLENVICISNLVLVGVLVVKNKKLDQNKLGFMVHSLISSASFLIFQFFDRVFLLKLSKSLYNFDIFVFSSYYFVFFWIISVYITNSEFMRKYIDRETIGNTYGETGKLDDSAQPKF